MPSSVDNGARPRLSAPSTLVVMPDERQSMPITAPNDRNQKGGQAARELATAMVVHDGLVDDRAQPRHARARQSRHAPAMQR